MLITVIIVSALGLVMMMLIVSITTMPIIGMVIMVMMRIVFIVIAVWLCDIGRTVLPCLFDFFFQLLLDMKQVIIFIDYLRELATVGTAAVMQHIMFSGRLT